MIKNLIVGFLAIAVFAWVLTACTHRSDRPNALKGNKPLITVSIPPQLFFVKAIAGDRIDTSCLLTSSSDPESFEPSMSQLMQLERSDAYIPLGVLPFEHGIIERLSSGKQSVRIVNGSEGINLLSDTHHGSSHRHAHHDDAGVADPHIWSSPRNAKIMALNTLNALIAADSVNEDVYRINYARLDSRLDSIDSSFRQVFAKENKVPHFLVWHPSLSYFAKDYGLHQIAVSEPGKELSVRSLAERLSSVNDADIKVCFYQTPFDSERIKELSSSTHIKIVEINPMNAEWEDEIQKLYDAFTLN